MRPLIIPQDVASTNSMGHPPIDALSKILPEKEGFPAKVDILAGRTLSKGRGWWKAILLVRVKYGNQEKEQLRLYAWQWNGKKDRWSQRQKYNFSSKGQLSTIVAAIQTYHGKEMKNLGSIALFKRVSELEEQLEEVKVRETRNRLPEMEMDLTAFERMMKKKSVKEHELEVFLHHHFWMFGGKYRRAHRETWAGLKGRNDFLLEKATGFYDIVELKRPDDPLFSGAKTIRMSGELKDAVSQMALYLDYYYKNYLSHKEQTGMDILYPKGIIVIGRRNESQKNVLEAHKAVFARNIEILTYDDILDEANQIIKNLKKRARRGSDAAP